MRIRGASSISSSSSPSDDHCSSISTSSLDPSTISFDSSTSFSSNSCSSSSSLIHYETRCDGLDLLVKAVLHVAGSVLVVPFTQRRVIRRRKRSSKFSSFFFIKNDEEHENVQQKPREKKNGRRIEVISKSKGGRKRELDFHGSVLQPWKRQSRRQQQRQPIFEVDD